MSRLVWKTKAHNSRRKIPFLNLLIAIHAFLLPNDVYSHGLLAYTPVHKTLASFQTNYLTPYSTILFQKLTGSQLHKKYPHPHFMESEISLPHSQKPATLSQIGPLRNYLSHFLKIHFNISLAFTSVRISGIVWTGLSWLRIGTGGGLL